MKHRWREREHDAVCVACGAVRGEWIRTKERVAGYERDIYDGVSPIVVTDHHATLDVTVDGLRVSPTKCRPLPGREQQKGAGR